MKRTVRRVRKWSGASGERRGDVVVNQVMNN